MSISLVLFRIEVVDDNPLLKDIEYRGTTNKKLSEENSQFNNSPKNKLNLEARRGLREPRNITVITYDEKAITQVMKELESVSDCKVDDHNGNEAVYSKNNPLTSQVNVNNQNVEKLVINDYFDKKRPGIQSKQMQNDSIGINNRTFQDSMTSNQSQQKTLTDAAHDSETSINQKSFKGNGSNKAKQKQKTALGKKNLDEKKITQITKQCATKKELKKFTTKKSPQQYATKMDPVQSTTKKEYLKSNKNKGHQQNDINLSKKKVETNPQHSSVKEISQQFSAKEKLASCVVSNKKVLDSSMCMTGDQLSKEYTHKKYTLNGKIKENLINRIIDRDSTDVDNSNGMKLNKRENMDCNDAASSFSYFVKEPTPIPCSSKEGTPVNLMESYHFESGNSLVEITKGILHFYKENLKTSLDEGEERSEMLCMIAVPTSMGVHDLYQFTAACYSLIQHLRIIKDSNPNQYLVLLKFRSQTDADFFYNNYNGQRFNNLQTEICKLVYVSRVETTDESEGSLPIPGHTELPNCPVCLERMDESVDGILTILCNHSFHGECLTKWGDTSCPVCRYCQVPDEVPEQRCIVCGATDSLWICLICGHVGCGRYVGGHAHNHFTDTSHLFALQVGNNRVWDYVRDNYVHRLLQSEGDGKVVSFERETNIPECKELNPHGEEKLTAIQIEYTYLLTTQMDSQREYFEQKINESATEAGKELEESCLEQQKLRAELQYLKESLEKMTREKKNIEFKFNSLNEKIAKVTKELSTEKVLSKSILHNNRTLAQSITNLEKNRKADIEKIENLEAQAADFMHHLAAVNVVQQNPDIELGAISIPEQKPDKQTSRRQGRRRGN